jgi:signal transduction histidine kinase
LPGLIVLNAISIPLAMPQIVLNLLLSLFYLSAGILYPIIGEDQIALLSVPARNPAGTHATNEWPQLTNTAAATETPEPTRRPRWALWTDKPVANPPADEIPTEPLFLLRLSVLWLLTACCYGVQVLAERQRRAEEEAREMSLRQGQLRSAGRLAAEFAHQIKNPLAIINNAAFSLQRALNEGTSGAAQQIKIIQEEVERSDKIVTQIMGYAQLSEGRVEKLNVAEELDRAIERVFPVATDYGTQFERRYASDLPPLLMQRGHLGEILVNLLQNAREASDRHAKVSVTAACPSENLIEIAIADNGLGIPPDKLGKIFEAYYTTKERGTGLGLAIVKHNVELYGGTVHAESVLGKGTRFVIVFPAKTALNPVKPS